MFDFFGVFSLKGGLAVIPSDPFQYLRGKDDLSYQEKSLDWSRIALITLCRKGEEPNAFLDPKVGVLVFGCCYKKMADDIAPGGRAELSAAAIASSYQGSKEQFYHDLKGSFVIIIYDREKECLCIYTDPLNLRSLYYYRLGKELVLSSSLNAVAAHCSQTGQPIKVDRRAVLDLYLFDYILDDHTYFQGVRELTPGTLLEATSDGLISHQLFDAFSFFDLSGPKLDQTEGVRQLKEVLRALIHQYDRGPDQTAVALTGGFDSRSILALMGERAEAYEFFSYGKSGSWDLKIPKLIASRLNLNYSPIFLEEEYRSRFDYYAGLAVLLSDGLAELTHANIAFVYANHLKDKTAILTGLFGSELIKTPSSRGTFIDTNTISLLTAADPVAAVKNLLSEAQEKAPEGLVDKNLAEEVIEMIRGHPFINNDLPLNEKYFYYLLMVGMRKYFQKEIKIQRPWKDNLHPFLDLEFVTTLLKTPFPWVYHFSTKKSLVRNLAIHKLYSKIIHETPMLSDIISTHGYRPRYLLGNKYLPLLLMEYMTMKKKISQSSQLRFQQAYAFELIDNNEDYLFQSTNLQANRFLEMRDRDPKNFLKLASLQYWLRSITEFASFNEK